MSRTTNILVVVIAILCVFVVGIMNVIGIIGDMSEPPAEWKDYFVLNGTQYFNTYNIIDNNFADKQLGKISYSVPRSVDASAYKASDGEAVYLPVGTRIYSIKGFDSGKYVAAYDDGDYYLYCVTDSSPKEVLEKCGVKSVRDEIDFNAFFVSTVCRENTDYGVRISVICKSQEFEAYLSRYVNDFSLGNSAFTYDSLTEKRTYDDSYFKKKILIAVRLPEDDGKVVFDLDSITADELKMTLVFKRYLLPDTVTYDSCRVRHLFVEVSAEDYVKQKMTYQIERMDVMPDATVRSMDKTDVPTEPDDDEKNPMRAVVKVIHSRREAVGTEYESLVSGGYNKEFFDENVLVVVNCTDGLCDSDYVFSGMERVGNRFKLNIERAERENPSDHRISFFSFALPIEKYRGALLIPSQVVSDGTGTAPLREAKDVLVLDSVRALEAVSAKYDITKTMYDEEFFEEHVLLFVGDLVCSDKIELKYVSVVDEDGVVRMEVDEFVPDDCEFYPSYRFAAIPYLRSALKDKEFSADIKSKFDKDESDGNVGVGMGGHFGMPFG